MSNTSYEKIEKYCKKCDSPLKLHEKSFSDHKEYYHSLSKKNNYGYSVNSAKKIISSPTYRNEIGTHYVVENSNQDHGNYVIVLDSGQKTHHHMKSREINTKEIESFAMASSEVIKEKEFWKAKVFEMEKVFEIEVETIKKNIMNECKTILDRELKEQAEICLKEKTQLEDYVREERIKWAEYEIKYNSFLKENERIVSLLQEKDSIIREKEIIIDSLKRGEENSILELRKHYEEMLKIQEDKFKQELEEKILLERINWETKLKIAERKYETYEIKIKQLQSIIENLNKTINDKNVEIEELQKQIYSIEQKYSLEEAKIKRDYEKLLLNLKSEYETKLKNYEKGIIKFDKLTEEKQRIEKYLLEKEEIIEEWKHKYHQLETMKQKEIIKEVFIEKPIVKETFEYTNINEITKTEKRIMQEKIFLEKEIERMRSYISELEERNHKNIEILYLRDNEINEYLIQIEKYKDELNCYVIQLEKIEKEKTTIYEEKEKVSVVINNYRRYIKELELLISQKNRDLYEKIKSLDVRVIEEDILLDIIPGAGYKLMDKNKDAQNFKTVKKTTTITKKKY